ncbi:helix-turn-helix domain-containing protein [Iningainema tapete]|uniref:Helix-turn-helix transcriptional regulator n=1 Tax=Iningainema tapete BLCC-T55 TaxID=2748662 RepID=A0A8J6XQ90_9CYAN|nr:AraC family transcriptional regulator [Iningainema tapete]MBD2776224.1 helix-turn-helix transcriptional regulator [Iningainema tapete BLCC-T55]
MPQTQPAVVQPKLSPTGVANSLPNAPVLSSGSVCWNNILVEQYQHPKGSRSNELPALSNHWLTFFLGQPARLMQKRDGRIYEAVMQAGEHTVIPAGQPSYWCCNGGIDILHIHLEPTFIAKIAEASDIDASRVEIINSFCGRDPQIQHIAMSLLTELKSPGLMGQLYVETLTNLLAIHLIRQHSAKNVNMQFCVGGLSPSKLQQVIEYIYNYLDQELTLTQLADVAGMSPGYFATLFKESTGVAPHQYVIHKRIEQAKQLLLKGELSISEVAHRVGFCDQGHLTRHMRRLLGVTPKTFLKTHN